MNIEYYGIHWNTVLNLRKGPGIFGTHKEVEIRRGLMRTFVVTALICHHRCWVFNLKSFPKCGVCSLVLRKSKKEAGNFWRRLLFNLFWGSCLCPVWERCSYIFLQLLLKFRKVENNLGFLSVCFFFKTCPQPNSWLFLYSF